jgi:hypothetical protein
MEINLAFHVKSLMVVIEFGGQNNMTDETNERNRLIDEAEILAEADFIEMINKIKWMFAISDLKKKGLLINKINQVLREMKI